MGRTIIALTLLGGLAACGDPLRDVNRLSDVQVAEDGTATLAETPAEVASPREGGLFSRLLNRQPEDPTNTAIEAALAEAGVEGEAPEEVVVAREPEQPRRGLFGLFRRDDAAGVGGPVVSEPEAVEASAETPAEAATEEAEVVEAAAVETPPETEARPRRGLAGLFARRAPEVQTPTGPDAQLVEAGTVMPFGEVARVCDLPNNRRGTLVANLGGYKVYDTIPNATAARPFYITGFDDNCARTFAGAMMIPSDLQTHEFVRYEALPDRPYTEVDNAYEAIKASACRVGRGRPCGDRADRLARDLEFLTVYPSFGSQTGPWAELLIHQGRVIAMDVSD